MIYLDNAATSYPKPKMVIDAVNKSFIHTANPGRSGYKASINASELLFKCREKIGKLVNFNKPENVILMSSCTIALNTVIKGTLKKGDHVIISSLEHNSVVRPIKRLADERIITYDVAEVFEGDNDKTVDSFRRCIKDNTKLCICTHASNVFGIKLPISRIGALCRYYGILFCVDTAQTIGICDIDIEEIGADYLCAPGHKGLYGPMGTGFLIINNEKCPVQLIEGGTGSSSLDNNQPQMLPDKYESGTVNFHGFCGLSAGIDFVNRNKVSNIEKHEMNLISHLYDELSNMESVNIYTNKPESQYHVPILSFNVSDVDCNTLAAHLDSKYNISLRAGLHCSPLAHENYAKEANGTLRVSPSLFTNTSHIKMLINSIYYVTKNKKILI